MVVVVLLLVVVDVEEVLGFGLLFMVVLWFLNLVDNIDGLYW